MEKIKIHIQHYQCGDGFSIIDCWNHSNGECRECPNHNKSHVEEREVTNDELLNLINNSSDWYDVSTIKPEN